jgi:hypothetical protein
LHERAEFEHEKIEELFDVLLRLINQNAQGI